MRRQQREQQPTRKSAGDSSGKSKACRPQQREEQGGERRQKREQQTRYSLVKCAHASVRFSMIVAPIFFASALFLTDCGYTRCASSLLLSPVASTLTRDNGPKRAYDYDEHDPFQYVPPTLPPEIFSLSSVPCCYFAKKSR